MVSPLLLNGIHTWISKQQLKKLKKYIYLISPQNIKDINFYNQLDQVLKTNKVEYFQLRLKKKTTSALVKIAKKIKGITKKNKVKLLINDKPFVAKKINADGCHLGQKDMNFSISKKILGKKKIIGMTCHNSKKLALNAKKNGANYIAFGAFFKSSTKKTTYRANLPLLRWAKKKISMPIVAIGGINSSNYKKILSNGANYIACSNYIWNNKKLDPVSAIKKFK
jgi:thiamine-phosphate pyrophosphorylase